MVAVSRCRLSARSTMESDAPVRTELFTVDVGVLVPDLDLEDPELVCLLTAKEGDSTFTGTMIPNVGDEAFPMFCICLEFRGLDSKKYLLHPFPFDCRRYLLDTLL